MDTIILQYIVAMAVFLIVNFAVWYVLDFRLWVPRAFDYKPFNCRKCATFWLNLAIAAGLVLSGWMACGVILAVLAVLNAVAMTINEREEMKW